MSEKKPLPCPFCNRALVIIKVDDEKDGTYWGHPRDTPPEECFIHSLIVFFDQVDNWNIRTKLEVAVHSTSPNKQSDEMPELCDICTSTGVPECDLFFGSIRCNKFLFGHFTHL